MIHRVFEPLRRNLPTRVSDAVRSFFTAMLTPLLFSYRSGHFRSSWKRSAVSRRGEPLPWYTYPCIDFLKHRDFTGKTVLEFGGGQSSLWWAQRAKRVVTLEGDRAWYEALQAKIPSNVQLFHVSTAGPAECVESVNAVLRDFKKFDVIVIDGLYRFEMIEIARARMAEGGAILCDNAETYSFYEGFKKSGLNRVDFFGHAPGVVLPHSSSLFFAAQCFLLSAEHPIPVIAAAE